MTINVYSKNETRLRYVYFSYCGGANADSVMVEGESGRDDDEELRAAL